MIRIVVSYYITLRVTNMDSTTIPATEVKISTIRNILRDLYAPCITSLESWNWNAYAEPIDSLSDDEVISYFQYILAGYTLTITESVTDENIFHPTIAP